MATIRVFQPDDMEHVLTLWLEASAKAHDFIDRAFWESKVPDMRHRYLPAAETYVYDEAGTIKGFLSLHGNTLAALFVSPQFQGQGIGTQLMGKAKDMRRHLTLTVYKENHQAIAFYQACGFRIETEQTDEHTGHPELVMAFHP
jgi:putative acetyltransferase